MNSVNLIGGLVKDPELKYSASGMAYLKFTLGVDYYSGKNKGNVTSYIPITIFGQRAEYLASYGHRGDRTWVTGKMVQDKWNDKSSGLPRSSISVVADDVGLISGGKREGHKEYEDVQEAPPVKTNENLDSETSYGDIFAADPFEGN